MAELDHIVFASRNVEAGVDHIERLTGVRAVAGGPHVGLGTHNHLLAFDDRTYFEIIGADPAQPEPAGPRPFGLDDQAGPALAGYAIHPTGDESLEDVVAMMSEAGFDPGPIADMSRRRPDGEVISWRLTRGGADGPGTGVPFAIDWGDQPSPAVSLPSMGTLIALTINHPDAALRRGLEQLGIGVTVQDGPSSLEATVDSPNGVIRIG